MSQRFYHLVIVALLCAAFAFAAPLRADAQGYFPNGLHGTSDLLSGISPGTDPGNCCWMGAQGSFTARVPAGADTLLLNVYLPKFALPESGSQSLRVQAGHAPAVERCCLGAGEHEVVIPLKGSTGEIAVRLWAGGTFVPKARGINDDPRHLSVMIRSVGFMNAATGERFDASAAPSLPARLAIPILAAAALIIVLLTLRRPVYGVAALIVSNPFLFAYMIHGTSITLPKVALLAVAAALLVRARRIPLDAPGTLRLLLGAQLLLVLSMAVSSVHAADHHAALRETLKAAEYAATIAIAYAAYRSDPDEGFLRAALAFGALFVCVPALAQEFGGAPEFKMIGGLDVARIAGPLEGPNQLAGYLGVVVPAMLAFAVLRAPLLVERAAIAIGLITCLLTLSRAGAGALALAAVLLLLLRYAPSQRPIAGVLTAAIFAGAFGLAAASFAGALHGPLERVFGGGNVADRFNGGLGVRADLWRAAYEMWRAHPLFGVGPGNYEIALGRYDPGVRTHANGMYFQVLAEQGIAGLAAMLAVVVASIGVFVRRLNHPLALGACAAAVAMAFHQVVDCMWIYPKVGVIWWIVLALGAVAVDSAAAPERVAEAAVA